MAQLVKNLPAMQETWFRSLGQEDPLEKEMATHSNTRAWRIPWAEEPGWCGPWDHKGLDRTEASELSRAVTCAAENAIFNRYHLSV